MIVKPRRKKSKKRKIPSGYDSTFEYDLHTQHKEWKHHPCKLSYVSRHLYEPDFVYEENGKVFYVEAKGRFRDRKEASKYLFVREALKSNEELIFIFQDSDKPMPNAKRRKDNTKQTHGEWAKKNGFKYVCYKRNSRRK